MSLEILPKDTKLHLSHLAPNILVVWSFSGWSQNIQKLQELNGEVDLLGRLFVRTLFSCHPMSTQILGFFRT